MKIIIVGCESISIELAIDMSIQGHDIVVIDKDKDSLKRLGNDFKGATVTALEIDEDVLSRAGTKNAHVFLAATNDDNANIMAAQLAKHVFKLENVIALIYDPEKEYICRAFDINTIYPNSIIAKQIEKVFCNRQPN